MKFKAVDWVRKIRDESYEGSKKMTPKEKIEHTNKVAQDFLKKRSKIKAGK